MKKCPFCAEEIQDDAIKCKHCGEFLDDSRPPPLPSETLPWYFRTVTVVIALLSVGPFALPLVIWHPKLGLAAKFGISAMTLIATWYLYQATVDALKMFDEQMKELRESGVL